MMMMMMININIIHVLPLFSYFWSIFFVLGFTGSS